MCRILIVDDEEVILFGFKKVLSGPGITVDTASSFKDAVRQIQFKSYTSIVTDLRLSGSETSEGLDVIREARRIQTACAIVVITGYGDSDTRENVLKRGADRYLEKPVAPERVRELLQSMGAMPN
jgi:DNA-binding response OmpR family regulator